MTVVLPDNFNEKPKILLPYKIFKKPHGNNKTSFLKVKKIRKTFYDNDWWFSIFDVIAVLAETPKPKTYWAKIKERNKEMSQPFPFWEQSVVRSFLVKITFPNKKS